MKLITHICLLSNSWSHTSNTPHSHVFVTWCLSIRKTSYLLLLLLLLWHAQWPKLWKWEQLLWMNDELANVEICKIIKVSNIYESKNYTSVSQVEHNPHHVKCTNHIWGYFVRRTYDGTRLYTERNESGHLCSSCHSTASPVAGMHVTFLNVDSGLFTLWC
jgi:hypothetical protein